MKHCGRKLRNMESTTLTFLCDECSIVWRMFDDVECVRACVNKMSFGGIGVEVEY